MTKGWIFFHGRDLTAQSRRAGEAEEQEFWKQLLLCWEGPFVQHGALWRWGGSRRGAGKLEPCENAEHQELLGTEGSLGAADGNVVPVPVPLKEHQLCASAELTCCKGATKILSQHGKQHFTQHMQKKNVRALSWALGLCSLLKMIWNLHLLASNLALCL